jgi:hypothetical protein
MTALSICLNTEGCKVQLLSVDQLHRRATHTLLREDHHRLSFTIQTRAAPAVANCILNSTHTTYKVRH